MVKINDIGGITLQYQSSTVIEGNNQNFAPTITVKQPYRHQTHALPNSTQFQMIEAAKCADYIKATLNRIITIRVAGMVRMNAGGVLRNGSPPKVVKDLLDKIMRWLKHRGIPVAFVWVREYSSYHGEHLHIGYHMQEKYDADFAGQIAIWLDEDIGESDGHKGTIFMSEMKSWNIRKCIRGNTSGKFIAAYLGKSEHNKITTAWGKTKINKRKPIRRKDDSGFGPIEGTEKHHYRWGTSYGIGRTQRDRQEYNAKIASQRPKAAPYKPIHARSPAMATNRPQRRHTVKKRR